MKIIRVDIQLYLPIRGTNKYLQTLIFGEVIINHIFTLKEIKEKYKDSKPPIEKYEELEDYFLVKDR